MTRMAGHKISDDGNRIVCTARPDAPCRTRPDCDTDGWDDRGCGDHDPRHPNTPGHDCWAIEWINAPRDMELWECADGWATGDLPIIPGRAVVLTWQDSEIGITWAYRTPTRHQEEA